MVNVVKCSAYVNRVKQDGILSPILFCIYISVLLERLNQTSVGCFIRNTCVGCVGCVDDVCLVAPSSRATEFVLSICEQFGLEYKVKFNSNKSHITACSNACIVPRGDFVVNAQVIALQDSVTHLGHDIGNTERKKTVID